MEYIGTWFGSIVLNVGAKVIKTILNNFYFHLSKKKLFVYLRPDFARLCAWHFQAA